MEVIAFILSLGASIPSPGGGGGDATWGSETVLMGSETVLMGDE